MNLTSRVRRAVVVAALASTIALAAGAAGAGHADGSAPPDPPSTEVPPVPPTDESPPGSTAGDAVPGPTPPPPVEDPSTSNPTPPPPAEDPSTSNPTPPAPPEPTVAPTTTNPPPAPEPIPPTTEPPVATQPPPAPPKTTQPPNAIPTTTTTPNAVPVTVAAMAATAPQSLVATPGNGIVKLTWKAPASNGGAAIDKYVVQRYNSAKKLWENVAFPKTTSHTVGSLTNGTTYSFRIRAHNAAGWGPVSTVVKAVPFTVPSAPSWCPAVQWGGDGSHTMVFQWKASPRDGGSPASAYEVAATKDGVNHGYALKSPGPGYVAWQLEYGWYLVSVRAVNLAGPGPWCTAGVLMMWP